MVAARHFDVLVLGAGAAGMMAAIEAARRGRSVLVIDHAQAPGEKIRISGGGRCNFTNINATVAAGRDRFLSQNPRFAFSALARYTPDRIAALIERYGITYHEKALGQLFCDGPATQVVSMLTAEMSKAGAMLRVTTALDGLSRNADGFTAQLSDGTLTCSSVVIATGGKSIPKMGATDIAYRLAAQFGLGILPTRPALVPLTFEPGLLSRTSPLSGVSTEAIVSCNGAAFREALLFTHRGLSGPAILQISSYWREGDAVVIDFLPDANVLELLRQARKETPRLAPQTVLAQHLPKRLAQFVAENSTIAGPVGELSDDKLRQVERAAKAWTVKPTGSEGYRTAEVTLGGVDTKGLDSTTMAARSVPGLFVVGEAVDVTGWLGGYNFQWAWASGWAAGQVA